MNTATLDNVPGWREVETPARPRPLFFREELRNKPTIAIHDAEAPWARTPPAKPNRALAEIAAKVFSDKDRKEIQRLENEIGKVDADRKAHCDVARIDQDLWNLSADMSLAPEELANRSRALEQERQDIPRWTMALDRKDAELKEKLRPYALRLATELPGFVAAAINEIEDANGPTGTMAFWGIGQGFNANVVIYPLRRLHDVAQAWLKSLEANDAACRESHIRPCLKGEALTQHKQPTLA